VWNSITTASLWLPCWTIVLFTFLPATAITLTQDRDYVISNWTTIDGLPGNSATSISQSPDGYLWIGTFNGLVRFDGSRFSVYHPSNTPVLPHDGILRVHRDQQGVMWFGTFGGLAKRQDNAWHSVTANDPYRTNPVRLISSNTNVLYAWFEGGFLARIQDSNLEPLPSPQLSAPRKAPFLFFDQQNNLMLASGPLLYRWTNSSWLPVSPPAQIVDIFATASQIIQNSSGELLVAGPSGFTRILGDRVLRSVKTPLPNVFSIEEEPDGTLWFASTTDGLYRLSTDNSVRHFNKEHGFPSNTFRFVARDTDGNIWAGTNGDGLIRLRKRSVFTFGVESGLPDFPVKSLAHAPDKSIFVATYGRGVYRFKDGKANPAFPGNSIPVFAQALLTDRSGTLWVGSYSDGLWRSTTERLERIDDFGERRFTVEALFEDSKGRIWVGCSTGVALYESGRFRHFPLVGAKFPVPIAAFAESPSTGEVWAGGDGGLYRLEGQTFLPVLDKSAKTLPSLRSLIVHPNGSLLLGTIADGILQFRDGHVLSASSPVWPAPQIGEIFPAGPDYWLATSAGLWRIKRDLWLRDPKYHAWHPFGIADGMTTLECSVGHQPIVIKDNSETLWVSTLKGIASLHLPRLPLESGSASPRIESISFRNGDQPIKSINLDGVNSIELPSESWDIRISYSAPLLAAPEKVMFHYLLTAANSGSLSEGYDASRELRLLRLPPGNNQLTLEARSGSGEWTRPAATLFLKRTPYLWENRYAQTAAALALIAALIFAVRAAARRHNLELMRSRQAEEVMLLAKQEAENASRLKSLFLANMSHELRTPMNGILGMTQLLQSTGLNPQQQEMIDTLQSSGSSLLRILNEILDISRIEAGRLDLNPVPIKLSSVIAETMELVRPLTVQKKIQLTAHIDPSIPATLSGDPLRIRQIVLNYLDNAIKFTPTGGVYLTAESVPAPQEKIGIRIAVTDTGCGIPEGKLSEIFDAFAQVDASSTRIHGGTGLGLTIVRRLARLMGGDAGVESVIDRGSTFWATLFLEPVLNAPKDIEVPLTPLKLNRPKILVAEDNRINQRVLAAFLQRLNCDFTIAVDGQDALEQASSAHFDLILMDVQMPRMDGLAATRAIRAMPGPLASIPIIAISASAMPEDMERCSASGMNGFLSKPVKLDDLSRELHQRLISSSC
jgi:signal transduction histidine kinase/ligand-binding sensor domain-containing protein/ActR/RegA family two-component response regulator